MDTKKITRISVTLLFLATVLLSLVPVVQTLLKGAYAGVPPAYVDDDIYYYGRMKEVTDRRPFLSNPYFVEYSDARHGAFFVADWLAATPLFLSRNFSVAIVFNVVFWSLICVFLAYLLARATNIPPPFSAVIALVSYIEVYWLILRPVAMQEVFPFFLLFLLALLGWLRNPLRRRSIWFLIIASASSFYIYTFLWQITSITLGLVFLRMLVQKRWPEVKMLLWVALGAGLLSLPAIIYIFHQINAPFYWETLGRMNLVESRLPSMDAYYYGRWAAVLTALYICARKWLINRSLDDAIVMSSAIYSGSALFIASIANIFIGKDLATGQHIGRFITLWVALFFPISIWIFWLFRKELQRWHWLKLGIIGLLSLACFGFLVSNLKRSLPFREIATIDSASIQGYAEPLHWLEQHEKQPTVIWANKEVSMYVPILTKHYVFWAPAGGLFIMPTKEVEDRFLASWVGKLTVEEILASYKAFEGSGVFSRYADSFNKNRLSCLIGGDCRPNQGLREWIGEETLNQLLKRHIELKKDMQSVMKEYGVSYLISDSARAGEDAYFKSLPGASPVWKNDRFVIYAVK